MFNKKAQQRMIPSTGFVFLLIIVALLLFGLGFILINQTVQNYLDPAFEGVVNSSSLINSSQLADYTTYKDRSVNIWLSLPAIVFVGLIIYAIVISVVNKR